MVSALGARAHTQIFKNSEEEEKKKNKQTGRDFPPPTNPNRSQELTRRMCYPGTPQATLATYLCRDATEPSKVPPTAGVHTRGPGDGLIVKDGEGKLAIRDEDNLESVYLQQGEEESSEGQ